MKKVFASILVIALAVVVATPAKAMTDAELLAALKSLSSTQLTQLLSGVQSSASSLSALTKNMKLGSKGDQVETLQKFLEEKGLLDTNGVYGYYGAKTKAAVKAYQKENGISQTGNCYQLTREAINAEIGSATPSTPVTTTPTAPVTLDNTDGSVTPADSSLVSSGQQVKKGETKDVYSVRLTATAGKVQVNRVDVSFSERPWLTISKVTLKDGSGKVLAEKALTSAADATEVTVGSRYDVRFENLPLVVTPGTDSYVVVNITSMSASDKISNQTVTVGIPSMRTINGKSYSETVSYAGTGSFTFTSTGSNGDIYTRISPNTPATRIVTTSASQNTPDVVLGVYGMKTQNQDATIQGLTFKLNIGSNVNAGSVLSNVRLIDPEGNSYGASSITSTGTTTFSNLTIKLAKDVWKDLTVKADVASGITGYGASTTLAVSGINGIDTNFNTLTTSNAATSTANDVNFLTSGVSVSDISATLGSSVVQNNITTAYNGNYSFKLTNTGNSDVYVSKTANTFVTATATDNVGYSTTTASITSVTVSPDTYAADNNSAYVIPAGAARTFNFTARIGGGQGTSVTYKFSKINFGTSDNTTASAIDFGISNLKLTATF